MYWEVLDKKRLNLLPKLALLRKHGFYLAGGTALALQLGHRKSLDFDFYTQKEFKSDLIYQLLKKNIPRLKAKRADKNTLITETGDIEISLFYYDYPLIKALIKKELIDLAAIEDIGAMKLVAVTQRGKKGILWIYIFL